MPSCVICGKRPQVGNHVSHANNKRKRRWNPNLQKVRIMLDGRRQLAPVCAQCIRSNKIVKVPHGQGLQTRTAS